MGDEQNVEIYKINFFGSKTIDWYFLGPIWEKYILFHIGNWVIYQLGIGTKNALDIVKPKISGLHRLIWDKTCFKPHFPRETLKCNDGVCVEDQVQLSGDGQEGAGVR